MAQKMLKNASRAQKSAELRRRPPNHQIDGRMVRIHHHRRWSVRANACIMGNRLRFAERRPSRKRCFAGVQWV